MKSILLAESKLSFSPSCPILSKKACDAKTWPLIPHRSSTFNLMYEKTSNNLIELIGCSDFSVILTSGSGTLSNDIMLASMINMAHKPMVLVNGEFGLRMFKQCCRYNSETLILNFGWGVPFDLDKIKEFIQKYNVDYLFFTAVETSSGMINEVNSITILAEKMDVLIGIDAVSALGVVDFDFSSKSIICVTASSGKGLAALAGIAILFLRFDYFTEKNINNSPWSLDIIGFLDGLNAPGKVRNTLSSLLLAVLHESVEHIIEKTPYVCFEHYRELKNTLIEYANNLELEILPGSNCLAVTTIRKPKAIHWSQLDSYLTKQGIELYSNINYLQDRDLFQVATYGDYSLKNIEHLFSTIDECLCSNLSSDNKKMNVS